VLEYPESLLYSSIRGHVNFRFVVEGSPAVLDVTPTSLTFGAVEGGANPAAQDVAINNTGGGTLSWTATADQGWISESPDNGGAPETMAVSADIAGLGIGTHTGTITVDAGAAGTEYIDVTLVISAGGDVAQLPFTEDFETGALASFWEVTGTGNFRTQVRTDQTPNSGSYHLTMDSSSGNARNELTLTINLAGASDVVLRFFAKEWRDENNAPATNPFTGGADFDGVAISEDGTTWYEVYGLRYLDAAYEEHVVYLDDAAAVNGLTYNGLFKIRFNQYDNLAITSDGIGLDDISIAEETIPVAPLPFSEDFETGVLAGYWKTTGTGNFRTQVTTAHGPHGGSYHVTMDSSSSNARNELTLMIDLAGASNVELRFWVYDYNDEDHGPPASPFAGGADFDGVAVSEDGFTWYEVHGLRGLARAYTEQVVDLDAAIAAVGLSYTGRFRIRFNQYDNASLTTDGIGIDDISITGDK
jgi:hypothetical protein